MKEAPIIPTERQTQRAILKMMGTCFPDVLVHHSPNGAHLAGNGVARFKQMGALLGDGMKKGWPDLICLWSPCQGCFIEVKRPKLGRVSTEQAAMQIRLVDCGWPVTTVTTVDDAYAFLKACGAPCRGELMRVAA
jgi:hypothetical protein